MGVQLLLNKGGSNSCLLEKIGDRLLTPARFLWLSEKISVNTNDSGNAVLTKEKRKINPFFCVPGNQGMAIVDLIIGCFYVIGSLCAITPLFFGLILKKIAVVADKNSKAYQFTIKNLCEFNKLKEQGNVIIKKIEFNKEKVIETETLKKFTWIGSVATRRRGSFSEKNHYKNSDEYKVWRAKFEISQKKLTELETEKQELEKQLSSKTVEVNKIQKLANDNFKIHTSK